MLKPILILLLIKLLLCLHIGLASTSHLLPTTDTRSVYFESQFTGIRSQITSLINALTQKNDPKLSDLLTKSQQLNTNIDNLQGTLNKYALPVSSVSNLCPGVTTFNRTDIRTNIADSEKRVTAMVDFVLTCSGCDFVRSNINQIQNLTQGYIKILNQTLDGKYCASRSPLLENVVGTVNLNMSYYKPNLIAKNWYYGSTTASDYKIYLFKRGSTFNLTTCPLNTPFVREQQQVCFDCSQGSIFNLGSQKCDTCKADEILNIEKGSCDKCYGQKKFIDGALKCKVCNVSEGYLLNFTTSMCFNCTYKSYIDYESLTCKKIECLNSSTPKFNMATKTCQPCGVSQVINPADITKCIKTNYVGVCPPETPLYDKNQKGCVACPAGQIYNQNTSSCVDGKSSHASVIHLQPTNTTNSTYVNSTSNSTINQTVNTITNKTNIGGSSTPNATVNVTNVTTVTTVINSTNTVPINSSVSKVISDSNNSANLSINTTSTTNATSIVNTTQISVPKANASITNNINSNNTNAVNSTTVDASVAQTTPICNQALPIYNTTSQKCEACPLNSFYKKVTKQCVDRSMCKQSQILNSSTLDCVEIASTCQIGETYVSKTFKCIPIKSTCNQNQFYDSNQKLCLSISSTCTINQFYDFVSKKCVSLSARCDGKTQFYDQKLYKCIKYQKCKDDQYFNFTVNLCEKTMITCLPNEHYDTITKQCTFNYYLTSPYLPNLIYNGDFNNYIQAYQSNKSARKEYRDCPLVTPYYNGQSINGCIACPIDQPYFDLQGKKCMNCPSNFQYNSNNHYCLRIQTSQTIPDSISKMKI